MSGNIRFERQTSPGQDTLIVDYLTHREIHLTLRPLANEPLAHLMKRMALVLGGSTAVIVRHEVFGTVALYLETMATLGQEFGRVDWPITWVEGQTAELPAISGMHVFAVLGLPVETIFRKNRPVGRIFSAGGFRHCLLGGVVPSSLASTPAVQSEETLELITEILQSVGMDMTNVVRTWFFLDRLLEWYEVFNRVRNEFFSKRKVFAGVLPASTGIGGGNPAKSALVAGAWAVQADHALATVREVSSPLQGPATSYGSAFSRAVLLNGGGLQRLFVSGTASIASAGQSIHDENLLKQVETSEKVVFAILKSRGFDLADITRATRYFKRQHDALSSRLRGEQCQHAVIVPADVCRPELLFEIELDAVKTNSINDL